MILVTGATGQLGRLVIDHLLTIIEPSKIIAAVRNLEKASDLAAKGIEIRHADYNQPSTLTSAFKGVEKVLLISSSEMGQRAAQHKAAIDAAKAAGVSLIAYTSILNAKTSPMLIAQEHSVTEALLEQSGVPYVLLRNGWYSENYTMSLPIVLEHGVVVGCASDAKFSTAPRADYAKAAAIVLTSDNQAGKVYELAGDSAFTLAEYAAAITQVSNETVIYQNLPESEYAKILMSAGLPKEFADLLADSEVQASKGALYSESNDLSTLIGQPTTPILESIKATL